MLENRFCKALVLYHRAAAEYNPARSQYVETIMCPRRCKLWQILVIVEFIFLTLGAFALTPLVAPVPFGGQFRAWKENGYQRSRHIGTQQTDVRNEFDGAASKPWQKEISLD